MSKDERAEWVVMALEVMGRLEAIDAADPLGALERLIVACKAALERAEAQLRVCSAAVDLNFPLRVEVSVIAELTRHVELLRAALGKAVQE